MVHYVAQSKRLGLQILNEADHLDAYFRLNSDPQSMAWSTKPLQTSLSETLELIRQDGDKIWNRRYAIMLFPDPSTPQISTPNAKPDSSSSSLPTETPVMIGVVGTPRQAEIAYKLLPEYWGKGYASEALALFLEMFWSSGINAPHLHIMACADSQNIGSQRVLEKVGFQKGRLWKSHYVLGRNRAAGVRSDLQSFWLDRPGFVGSGGEEWLAGQAELVMREDVRAEDVDAIRKVLEGDGIERKNLAL